MTRFRQWSKQGLVAALLLLTLPRLFAPALALPAPAADGFLVVMCSSLVEPGSPLQSPVPAPEPPAHNADCTEHCLGAAGASLAPPPARAASFVVAPSGLTEIFPEPRPFSSGSLTRSQSARAPPFVC